MDVHSFMTARPGEHYFRLLIQINKPNETTKVALTASALAFAMKICTAFPRGRERNRKSRRAQQ
jgi:hypothetical protein